jgi:hypothetical protein
LEKKNQKIKFYSFIFGWWGISSSFLQRRLKKKKKERKEFWGSFSFS